MGRTRGFDETVVVAHAAREFLTHGYDATSLDTLVAVTGLHRGSLYGAFGSKRGLFMAVLRLAELDCLSDVERIDLLLVALLEVAREDRSVRDLVQRQVEGLPSPATQILGQRLLERAGVTTTDELSTKERT